MDKTAIVLSTVATPRLGAASHTTLRRQKGDALASRHGRLSCAAAPNAATALECRDGANEHARGGYSETFPGALTDAEVGAGRIKQRKSVYEFLRHLMTLDAGALVLIATLVEKVFTQPTHRAYVGVSVLLFFLGLMGAGLTYLVLLANAPRVGALRMTSVDRGWYFWAMWATFSGFMTGMGFLAWFFAVNWFGW